MIVNKAIFSKSTLKIIFLIWMVFTLFAAFFIPQYDFGFDGVKVWFFFSAIMLVTLFAAALSLSLLKS